MAKKKYQISELRESDNDYQTRRRINENFKQLFSMIEDALKTGGSSIVSDSRTTVSAGCILPFAGTEAPNGFLMCDGRLYPIIDYPKLFESIGYTYGGFGELFAVPDLNGRTLIGSNELYPLGSTGGEAEVTLSVDEMPSHTHTATSYYDDANYNTGTIPTDMGRFSLPYDAGTITRTHKFNNTGGNQPHNNMQPYLAINYIICCSQ